MKKLLFASALIIGAASVRADDSSIFQASLTPNIAIHPRTTEIRGLSLNIYGENPQHGVALGLANGSTGESGGFTVGVYNYNDTYTGVQWGFVNISKQGFHGWQSGVANISHGEFHGWQQAYVNVGHGLNVGLQSGLINIAEKVQGVQIGVVNYAKDLHGVQVGAVNIAMNNGWFNEFPDKLAKGFPIVNWSF